jgi:hypothetical protein
MAARYVKEGDVGIPFPATLTDTTGAVVNLTGASVDFVMRLASWVGPTPPLPKINADATIVAPLLGTVLYTSQATDFDEVGTYFVEWEVTFAGGGKQRFPGDGYNMVAVRANLE